MQASDLIDYSNVESLLPHTGVLVLLDKIIGFYGNSLTAQVTVRNDGLFTDAKAMPAWVGIEYMAQAVGAYAGIQSILAGEPIRLGYLLGTRRYRCNVPHFDFGCTFLVNITKIIQDETLGVFDCSLEGKNVQANANLNVYQPKTDTTIFQKP